VDKKREGSGDNLATLVENEAKVDVKETKKEAIKMWGKIGKIKSNDVKDKNTDSVKE
jgi:hypothetical protein